jgi:hypothetical protein
MVANVAMDQVPTISARPRETYHGPFVIMTVPFFMWGFMTVFSDTLILRFKDAFTLDYFHAMLVQFAFGAYFVGSLFTSPSQRSSVIRSRESATRTASLSD